MDTTVILAQPRVSRLRADAVYVEKRALREAPAGEFQDRGFSNVIPGAETPFFWPTERGIQRKKRPIGRRDLAAKIQVFHCPT